jgi:diguanylate cyclase (GGDEF)-like protein/PAS domain S-box-containing protein
MLISASIRQYFSASRWGKVALIYLCVIAVLGLLAMVRLRVLSSIRSQIAAESIYSKSQKDAVFDLLDYAAGEQEHAFLAFEQKIALPLASRNARAALDASEPDFSAVKEDLLAAGGDGDDIDDVLFTYRLARLFHVQPDIMPAWREADDKLAQLNAEARHLHELLRDVAPDRAAVQASIARIRQANDQLIVIEHTLSTRMQEVAHNAQRTMVTASWLVALTFVLGGIFVARLILAKNEKLGEALRVSEERLRLAMSGSNDGLWDWDIAADSLYYSQRLLDLLGADKSILGKDSSLFLKFVHPADLPRVRGQLMAHLRFDAPYDAEFRIVTATGDVRWVRSRAQSLRAADSRALRMAGSITDITERRLSEELLYAEKERAQVTLESIGDAVITTGVDGKIEYLNPAATAITGWPLNEAQGKPTDEVCSLIEEHSREKVATSFDRKGIKLKMREVETNLLLIGKDGHEVAVNRSVAQIRNRNGQVIGTVFVLHDVSKDRAYATHLSYQASHDELTGLINRREFERRVSVLLGAPQSTRTHSMLYVDLDQFKIVNDTCGHLAGDELLKQLAELLKARLRQNDTIARLGGDEFGVLLEACPTAPAVKIAEMLRQTVSDFRFVWRDRVFPIGASIGLVTFGDHPATLADILRMADAACYQAKDNGRNRIHIFSPEDKELALRHGEMGWIGRIRQALEEDRFVLYSQKILPLDAHHEDVKGVKTHYEILLRMLDENNNIVPPIAFIPAAERYGLMPALDRWVIKNAFSLYVQRAKAGARGEICAINLSGTSIGDVDFLPFVRQQFLLYPVPPQNICFEITETSAIANLGKAEVLIRKLKDFGCQISLDDFGSGMSSFSYLKHLPVDYLKIDGSFVKDMMLDPIDHAMVEAINRIGQVMKIKTVAEFVEDEATLNELRTMGVNFAQGYVIERPAAHRYHAAGDAFA